MKMKHSFMIAGLLLTVMFSAESNVLAIPNTPECRAYANYARSAGAAGTYGPLTRYYKACLRSANRRGPAPQVKYPQNKNYYYVNKNKFKNYKKYQRCINRKTPCDKRCLRGITNKRLSHNAGIACYQRCGAYRRLTRCERLYGR